VLFHPKLPLIASASEDGIFRFVAQNHVSCSINSQLRHGIYLGTKEFNMLACGFDEGNVVIEPGSDDPVVSMDTNGKIVWAKNSEIQTTNVRGLASGVEDSIGERLSVLPSNLGACELYPQMLKH